MAASAQVPMPPAPKKTSPLVWILVGVAGFFLLIGMVVIAGGVFVAKQVQDVVANPEMAAAKLLAAANPDVEIVSSDEGARTITLKEKSTGKVVTVDFDRINEGNLTFEQDGQKVTVSGSEEGVRITGSDGSMVQIGSSAFAKLPGWLPAYPGATAEGTFAMQGSAESSAMVSFSTKDPVAKIAKYYEDALRGAQLTPTVNLTTEDGKPAGGIISAESADRKRGAMIHIAAGEDGQTVGVTYTDKK